MGQVGPLYYAASGLRDVGAASKRCAWKINMKINCDKCQAKYSIADEKVRGKTFKIRCKKCGNVIIVRDKAAAGASADSSSAGTSQNAGTAVAWHIAVGGETVGPLSENEVLRRIEDGELDYETSIWRDGFDDWAPLSSVERFAPVLERAMSSRSSSAFGSTASVDTGGSALGFGSQSLQPSSSDAPSSPRVANLTAQRNENSVLFSLDSLQKLATSGSSAPSSSPAAPAAASESAEFTLPREEPTPSPLLSPTSFTPSTSAPTSEGSGLIDIRAMSAVVSETRNANPSPREDTLIPSFAGSGFGGLSAQPVAVEDPLLGGTGAYEAAPAAPARPARSITPIVIGAAVVVLALGGAGIYFASSSAQREADAKIALAQAETEKVKAQAEADKAKAAAELAQAEKAKAEAERAAAGSADGGDNGDAGKKRDIVAAAPSAAERKPARDSRKSSAKPRRPRPSSSSSSKSAAAPAAVKEAPKKAEPKKKAQPEPKKSASSGGGGSDNIDVDCLLNPNLAKCGKKGASGGGASAGSSKKSAPKASAEDPSLPQSLSPSQLLAGLRGAKSKAKSCGRQHGAAPGTKVRIRMSIAGASGKVESAEAQGDHAGTALGKCVAQVARQARFPKFKKSNQGMQYNFRM